MGEIFNYYLYGGPYGHYPSYCGDYEDSKPRSKKRILSGKELAKRKVKRNMAKQSRKINRKG
jgi:hypothetical protein